MDGLGWIIVIVLLFLFGNKFGINVGAFTQPNALPTPDGLTATTTQDQNKLNTANAPAPWTPGPGSCVGSDLGSSTIINAAAGDGTVVGSAVGVNPVSQSLPIMAPVSGARRTIGLRSPFRAA